MAKINSQDITLDFLKSLGREELIVTHKDEDFYFKINIKEDTEVLVVHTNGAIDYSKRTPPVYQRSSWAKNINANCIFIDDRTLHKTEDKLFNTAWLMGTKDRHYIYDYSDIVKIIQNILTIDDNKVFYWGSSAGGTVGIALATLHKDSTAIANNPQTNILKDNLRRKNAIFRNVFPNMSVEEAIQSYYYRLSLAAFMHHHNYVPNIYYILNNKSNSDMNNHYQPFMEEIEKYNLDIDNKLTVWLYNDETRGHSPLLPDKTLEYLHTIISFKHL